MRRVNLKLKTALLIALFCNTLWAFADSSSFNFQVSYPIVDELSGEDQLFCANDGNSTDDLFTVSAWDFCFRTIAHSTDVKLTFPQTVLNFFYYSLYPRAPPHRL